MEITQGTFGEMDGQKVGFYTLKNDNGMEMTCINYGCIITEILVPDRKGKFENVVLGFDNLDDYREHSSFFGAIIGRVAGRIKNAEFQLDGHSYELSKNENNNHIHGGPNGFSQVLWDVKTVDYEDAVGIEFSYMSPDGDEGYPGTLEMTVTYRLNNDNELSIIYDGLSDEKTLLNPTNHSYFNLSGNLKRDVLDHVLTMDSDKWIELNEELLPTGRLLDVKDTAFDFQHGRKIRDGVQSTHSQNQLVGQGYDHPFLLSDPVISLTDEKSGRQLEVWTDQPVVVCYSGNQLDGDFAIRGVPVKKHLGICLETQTPPDSIHHSNFQSAILDKGERYQSKTKYKFT
ncbi:aldose epimerase family protein [Tuberibacillus sp. Marseille-P3662]|uniref:aldose epimerase family protein n=1 Tax=Tuberibacillus sp. Marseille-P3662 TaxID=1965358 RepID=UPI000A1CB3E8|nr:aldose epimerase family protein [Tuberibacillus sp. Marseille-P3662]